MPKKPVFNLILLGDPTAGKATQAVRLLKEYSFLQEFDLGAWLRSLKTDKVEEQRIKMITGKGILVPTQFARAKFKEVIFSTPPSKGIFFDGNPKMLGEAKLIYKWMKEAKRTDPLVIYLSIPRREILKRLGIREANEGRADDRLQSLKNRLKYYARDIPAVVRFFKKHYSFKKISGLGTRAEVYKRLITHIKKELKS